MPAWVLVFFSPGGSTGTGQCCVRISCAFDAQIHGLRRLLIAANIERRQVRGIDLDEALKTANENAVRPHPRHAPSDQSTAPPSGTARHGTARPSTGVQARAADRCKQLELRLHASAEQARIAADSRQASGSGSGGAAEGARADELDRTVARLQEELREREVQSRLAHRRTADGVRSSWSGRVGSSRCSCGHA
jgi:hypothetical protein